MKNLIVFSHPNPASFCSAIKETVISELGKKNHSIEIRDLYKNNFNPILSGSDFEAFKKGSVPKDTEEEQKHVKEAENLIFIYPIWWTGLPAMIKGYIDRVFTYGFAYKYDATGLVSLLTGKKVVIINTQGTPAGVYEKNNMHESIKMTSDTGIFKFCGIEVIAHKFFEGVPSVDDSTRKGYLKEVAELISKL